MFDNCFFQKMLFLFCFFKQFFKFYLFFHFGPQLVQFLQICLAVLGRYHLGDTPLFKKKFLSLIVFDFFNIVFHSINFSCFFMLFVFAFVAFLFIFSLLRFFTFGQVQSDARDGRSKKITFFCNDRR